MEQLNQAELALKRNPQTLDIIRYPDPSLNVVSKPCLFSIQDDSKLQALLEDMVFTVKMYGATGLSAIQVGIALRVMVIQDDGQILKIINPVLKSICGKTYENEGCLSLPLVTTRIARPNEVELEYFDETGKLQHSVFTGLQARTASHEIDHMDGVLFLDHMNSFQRASILRKFNKKMKDLGKK